MNTIDLDKVKQMNMSRVLDLLIKSGPLSRAEIARRLSTSKSTITSFIEVLLKQELVVELEKGDVKIGRKPILIDVNYAAGNAIGLKINIDSVSGALVDLTGSVICSVERSYTAAPLVDSCVEVLFSVIRELMEFDDHSVIGIGLGMGGRIDYSSGVILESSVLPWKNIGLAYIVEKEFSIPVFLENDVTTFAVGENFFGIGKSHSNYLCITLGQGIGAGIIINNQIHKGVHHAAGEFGHTKLYLHGDQRTCSCGEKGCLEAYASTPALLSAASEAFGRPVTIESLISLASDGDEAALKLFSDAGELLGQALSNTINMLDPEVIILGGEGSAYAEFILPSLKESVVRNSVYSLGEEIEIVVIPYESDLWVRGVAAIALMERLGISF